MRKTVRRPGKPRNTRPRREKRSALVAPAPAAVNPVPIVGVGASAGGLDAFRQLLEALPADTGLAYVLVQHLDPHHESLLANILSKSTSMPVSEVRGDVPVEANRIYIVPPSRDIVLAEGILKLVPRTKTGGQHMPIDYFLRTLAAVQGSRAIGVILSGMASDGTLGLKAIKAEGGIAFAQDPASAQADGCRAAPSTRGAWISCCPPPASPRSCRAWASIPTSPGTRPPKRAGRTAMPTRRRPRA